MKKYRKKPLVVEAEQWFPDNEDDRFIIGTQEGSIKLNAGDWIITGIEGEQYPCRESVFQKTYEEV